MGSIQSSEDICGRCGNPNVTSDYYYRSGEGWSFCNACGNYYSTSMKYDNNGCFLCEGEVHLLNKGIVLGIKNFHSDKLEWSIPLNKTITEEKIQFFLKRDKKTLHDLGADNARYNIDDYTYTKFSIFFLKDEAYEDALLFGCKFRLEIDDDCELFILEKPILDIKDVKGYGVIYMYKKSDPYQPYYFNNFKSAVSEEDGIRLWNAHMREDLDKELSYLTIWDEENQKLKCLKGQIGYGFIL